MVAFDEATATAAAASAILKLGAVMVFLSAPLAFPVCQPYNPEDIAQPEEEEEAMNDEENNSEKEDENKEGTIVPDLATKDGPDKDEEDKKKDKDSLNESRRKT